MGRKFIEVFLGNLLIVVALIPMVILLNGVMASNPDSSVWTVASSLLLGGISYLSYKLENKKVKK